MIIAIVDDEKYFLDMIQEYLKDIQLQKIDTYSFLCVEELENASISYDLLLLDIDMPNHDGIMYAKKHSESRIAFVTNYGERMKEAFGPNIYGFIEKNDSKDIFCEKIEKIIQEIYKEKTINLKTDIGLFQFKLKNIVYGQCISERKISFVVDKKKYIHKGKSLQEFVELLGEDFYLISRDTFVNINRVSAIIKNKVVLRGVKEKLEVSLRRQKTIKNIFLGRTEK